MTWYDVLGVLPGAEAGKIKREYDAKTALLRPELIWGAPPNVVKAVSRARDLHRGRLRRGCRPEIRGLETLPPGGHGRQAEGHGRNWSRTAAST